MQENKLNTYIEDENEAQVGAETENKIRNLSKIGITYEQNKSLNEIAEKHAEKSMKEYREKEIETIEDLSTKKDSNIDNNSKKEKESLETEIKDYARAIFMFRGFFDDDVKDIIMRIDALKIYAKMFEVEFTVDSDIIQEIYEELLSKRDFYLIYRLWIYAKSQDLKIDIDENTTEKIKEIVKKEVDGKEIDGAVYKEVLQAKYEEYFGVKIRRENVEKKAKQQGIELVINKEVLQRIYDNQLLGLHNNLFGLHNDDSSEYSEIEKKAKQQGIELSVNKDLLIRAFKHRLAHKDFEYIKYYLKYLEKNGIEVDILNIDKIDKNLLKEIFQDMCINRYLNSQYDAETFYRIKEFANKNGIEVDFEELYIDVIHNLGMGHADYIREEASKLAQKNGSQITYEDIVKINYLDHENIPKDQRLELERSVSVDGESIKSVVCGHIKDSRILGKFVMGTNREGNREFIFDATLGEHKDIGVKYDLEVIGGGWITLDQKNKKIKIYGRSQKFGVEPRDISEKIMRTIFSDYEMQIPDYL